MKTPHSSILASTLCRTLLPLLLLCQPVSGVQPALATQFDFSSETTPGARKFYFETVPGHRYTLWRSTDLENWEAVAGYPKTADGLSMEHTFAQGVKEFFRVEPIDDQAPVVKTQYPMVDGFAVGRFADLSIELADASGVDPASIRLTVASSGEMQQGHAGLTISGNTITYDSGDTALGAWGETLTATLVAADSLGHTLTHTWSFRLEAQANVQPNLFVFGSVAAQRSGQKLPNSPTSAVARQRDGRLPMGGGDEWSITTVDPASVLITYTGAAAPAFAAGTYLANRTPVNVNDIFYRKITSVADNAAAKTLTLGTLDVPFAEIVPDGSIEVNDQTIAYDLDAAGNIQRAVSFDKTYTCDPVGFNLDGYGPASLSGSPAFVLNLPEAHLTATPTLRLAFETKWGSLREASVNSSLVVDAALTTFIQLQDSGSTGGSAQLHPPVRRPVSLGAIGPVPVWVDLTYTTTLNATAEGSAVATLTAGWKRQFTYAAGVSYEKDRSPAAIYNLSSHDTGNLWQPIVLSGAVNARARISIEPKLDAKLWSLAGFWTSVDPGYETNLTSNGALTFYPQNGSIDSSASLTATLSRGFNMYLRAGFSVVGLSDLPEFGPKPLIVAAPSTYTFEATTPQVPLAFVTPTAAQTLRLPLGSSFTLHSEARGSTAPISYRWYQNGRLLPGAVSPDLTVPSLQTGNLGTYTVTASQNGASVTSPEFLVTSAPAVPLQITDPTSAQAFTKNIGQSVYFQVTAEGGEGLYEYQWMKNGVVLQNQPSFSAMGFNSVTLADEGLYAVKVTAGGVSVTSPAFVLDVVKPGTAPDGFALIPAGSFQMGDQSSPLVGWSSELPVHTVQVSAFFMAKYETTKELWEEVRTWGLTNGYTDLAVGNGGSASKGANHPVHSISWYDMVKWCNARSEKDNLVPCYTVGGATYKTGRSAPVCNWSVSGYRLPTEAEWEKAARGGVAGKNFPWGTDTITHSQANFWNNGGEAYQSGTTGAHPTYAVGDYPYSSPVGSFAPNGYGLYDMAGNMWEWCWDWWGSYAAGSQTDPRGPATGSNRVIRGGCWSGGAGGARCAGRGDGWPYIAGSGIGFRLARGQP